MLELSPTDPQQTPPAGAPPDRSGNGSRVGDTPHARLLDDQVIGAAVDHVPQPGDHRANGNPRQQGTLAPRAARLTRTAGLPLVVPKTAGGIVPVQADQVQQESHCLVPASSGEGSSGHREHILQSLAALLAPGHQRADLLRPQFVVGGQRPKISRNPTQGWGGGRALGGSCAGKARLAAFLVSKFFPGRSVRQTCLANSSQSGTGISLLADPLGRPARLSPGSALRCAVGGAMRGRGSPSGQKAKRADADHRSRQTGQRPRNLAPRRDALGKTSQLELDETTIDVRVVTPRMPASFWRPNRSGSSIRSRLVNESRALTRSGPCLTA